MNLIRFAGIGFGRPSPQPAEGDVSPHGKCWHWLGLWATVRITGGRGRGTAVLDLVGSGGFDHSSHVWTDISLRI
eukprot:5653944-Amphidinium_carterae.1